MMPLPSMAADALRQTRRAACLAWRYPRPPLRAALLAVLLVLGVAHEVRSVTVVHEARRERDAACSVAVKEIVRTSKVHDRTWLPASPCRALAELQRSTVEKVLARPLGKASP